MLRAVATTSPTVERRPLVRQLHSVMTSTTTTTSKTGFTSLATSASWPRYSSMLVMTTDWWIYSGSWWWVPTWWGYTSSTEAAPQGPRRGQWHRRHRTTRTSWGWLTGSRSGWWNWLWRRHSAGRLLHTQTHNHDGYLGNTLIRLAVSANQLHPYTTQPAILTGNLLHTTWEYLLCAQKWWVVSLT